jgi:N,N'-diacetylchitobiose transport system substrate-binding protein
VADGKKLMKKYGKDRHYSAVYFPGKYWYFAMSFVYDYGGQIAVRKGGKWKGTLNTPRALAALNQVKRCQAQPAPARPVTRRTRSRRSCSPRAQVGSFVGNGWEWPYALDTKVGNPALDGKMNAYPMPSHTKGKFMPTFLGGSDLAVPVTTKNQASPATGSRRSPHRVGDEIAKAGNIANTTKLLAFKRRTRSSRRSRRRRSTAGSCPRARTGPTWRMRTCCRTCSSRSHRSRVREGRGHERQ